MKQQAIGREQTHPPYFIKTDAYLLTSYRPLFQPPHQVIVVIHLHQA